MQFRNVFAKRLHGFWEGRVRFILFRNGFAAASVRFRGAFLQFRNGFATVSLRFLLGSGALPVVS